MDDRDADDISKVTYPGSELEDIAKRLAILAREIKAMAAIPLGEAVQGQGIDGLCERTEPNHRTQRDLEP